MCGVVGWAVVMAAIVLLFMGKGGKARFNFLTGKMEDEWYWWELLLLLRKIGIMCCGLFNTSNVERGWFLGSFVIILSVCAHSYARPYKSGLIDACEFVSLLSTLLIFQMGMVWNSPIASEVSQQHWQFPYKCAFHLIRLMSTYTKPWHNFGNSG